MPEQSWCVDGTFFAHFSTRGSLHCNFIISDGHLLLSKHVTSFVIYKANFCCGNTYLCTNTTTP